MLYTWFNYSLFFLLEGFFLAPAQGCGLQPWKKQTPWTPQSSINKYKNSTKFGFLNVQIRYNFKNINFITCKWSKICKYYVNSMVISCSTCQKKENNAHRLIIWFTLFCCDFKFVVNYAFFPPNLYSQSFKVYKKKFHVWRPLAEASFALWAFYVFFGVQ